MQMLKVYIEVNAYEEPLLMEVADNVPVARLIFALVRELALPRTDLMGGTLIYVLRHMRGGKVLPAYISLSAAGIQPETYLVLEPYTPDEFPTSSNSVTAKTWRRTSPLVQEKARNLAVQDDQSAPVPRDAAFYAGQTIADESAFSTFSAPASARSMPTTLPTETPAAKRWPRRLALCIGGAALGMAGLSVGYATFHSLSKTQITLPQTQHQTTTATGSKPTAPHKPFIPTKASQSLVFTQHHQTVRTVAWSPNGNLLASGANDRLLLTWDQTGNVHLRENLVGSVRAVAWSTDGSLLTAGSNNQIVFLDAQNGTVKARSTHTHRAAVTALTWSLKQPQLLVSTDLDRLAVVWNQSFHPQTMFKLHTTAILAASWSSDNQTIGTSSQGGVIRIWNAQTAQSTHGFYNDGATAINAVSFNPTSTVLAAGGADGVLRLWQNGLVCQNEGTGNQQGQCLDTPQRLHVHTRAILAAAWSSDGRFLATAGDDGLLLVWYPAQSHTPLLKIQQNAPINALAWSPDNKSIACASGTTVTLWVLV